MIVCWVCVRCGVKIVVCVILIYDNMIIIVKYSDVWLVISDGFYVCVD